MLIQELTVRGILSFGPDTEPLELRPLNLLIGPNGSGKSNLIETISLLRAAPSRLTDPLRGTGGGVREWLWKGADDGTAMVGAVLVNEGGHEPLRHVIEFTAAGPRFELVDERIEYRSPAPGHVEPYFFYRYQNGRPVLSVSESDRRQLQRQDVAVDESILSQRKDPDQYPELAYLATQYRQIRIYREWSFGRASIFRAPQPADAPVDGLHEDYSNLGLFLNRLRTQPRAKQLILQHLRNLYEGLDDFDVHITGGTVEVFLTEGEFIIPASRLSDGTLRYLCLLAILCDPSPPPLICIEEPELGLHPDLLPEVARLLVTASERTQLVVTTHSDILVDAMTEQPEAVVIVEKQDRRTRLRRLEASADLAEWLGRYRLGELWIRGDLGGVRW